MAKKSKSSVDPVNSPVVMPVLAVRKNMAPMPERWDIKTSPDDPGAQNTDKPSDQDVMDTVCRFANQGQLADACDEIRSSSIWDY
jgi:hypothetical protein